MIAIATTGAIANRRRPRRRVSLPSSPVRQLSNKPASSDRPSAVKVKLGRGRSYWGTVQWPRGQAKILIPVFAHCQYPNEATYIHTGIHTYIVQHTHTHAHTRISYGISAFFYVRTSPTQPTLTTDNDIPTFKASVPRPPPPLPPPETPYFSIPLIGRMLCLVLTFVILTYCASPVTDIRISNPPQQAYKQTCRPSNLLHSTQYTCIQATTQLRTTKQHPRGLERRLVQAQQAHSNHHSISSPGQAGRLQQIDRGLIPRLRSRSPSRHWPTLLTSAELCDQRGLGFRLVPSSQASVVPSRGSNRQLTFTTLRFGP